MPLEAFGFGEESGGGGSVAGLVEGVGERCSSGGTFEGVVGAVGEVQGLPGDGERFADSAKG